MAGLAEFTIATPRPLPVIVLADVSGSMTEDGKIDALNNALQEMCRSFAREIPNSAEILLAVITFGGAGACVHTALTPASKASWTPMQASGMTPLGSALDLATRLIEDRSSIPARAYRPAIILVSDGEPNDDWNGPLSRLLASPRGSKADRFALAIGAGAGISTLEAFLADPSKRVLQSSDASQIQKFFEWVTMSVTVRSKSVSPDTLVSQAPPNFDEVNF